MWRGSGDAGVSGAVPEGVAVFFEEAVAEDPLEERDEVDWGEAEA